MRAIGVRDTSADVFGLVAVSWSMRGSLRMASMMAGVVSVMAVSACLQGVRRSRAPGLCRT